MANRIEYKTWHNLISRCTKPSHKLFHYYGGRGITVCDSWLSSFENFLNDMGAKPSPYHSIDRINNDMGYSPENCRWATRSEQSLNKRCVKKVHGTSNMYTNHGCRCEICKAGVSIKKRQLI